MDTKMPINLLKYCIVLLFSLLTATNVQAFEWSQKARWIGTSAEDQCLYSPYLAAFRISFKQKLEKPDSQVSLMWGIDDERLMSAGFNSYGMQAGKGESWVKLTYQLAGDSARIDIYRQGYSTSDQGAVALATFNVPKRLFSSSPQNGWHSITVASCLGDSKFYFDGKEIGTFNLNPLGRGGDFIAYPVLGNIGISVAKGACAEIEDVHIDNYRSPQGMIARIEQLEGEYDSETRCVNPSRGHMPLLRGNFHAEASVKKAMLHVTARGIYDATLNGQAVNHGYFAPGYTQYNKTQPYQTFDVTHYIHSGANHLDVQLAEGWWMGAATFEGKNWNYFGDRLSMLCQLDIEYANGHKQTIVSSPESWVYSLQSPVVYGSFFQGEVYDANSMPTADSWKPCEVVELENHVSHEGWGNGPAPDDYSQLTYLEVDGNDVDSIMTLKAQSVSLPASGQYIYDMGQNMVGVPLLHFRGLKKGQQVKIRYAEVLYPDMPESARQKGMLMLENIRAAMAQDIYIAKGEPLETFSPRYTSHGFRYMEISGIDSPMALNDVQAIVLSSVHDIKAHFECSDSLVNQLWQNIEWSTRGNFVSIPTDCPQRNERLGWCGDISVYSPTATYLTDVQPLLRRFLRSMRDVQHDDGRFPDIAPLGGGFGGFLWGSAGITVPWEMYEQWADTATLREHYPAMVRYMDYVAKHYFDPTTHLLVQEHQWGDLDDWLGPTHEQDDKSLIWEAYYIHCLDIMEKAATVLGFSNDAVTYGQLANKHRDFFRTTYINPTTGQTIASAFKGQQAIGKPIDTEASYVVTLAFHIVDGELQKLVADNLIRIMNRQNKMDNGKLAPAHTLLTGFIGTSWISRVLSECGHTDEAYRLLLQHDYPSWLYPVIQGATTIWERLNSYTHEEGFGGNNRMNSFNHYSFGAVGFWLIAHSLGIQRDRQQPGFQHFVWAPEADPTGQITHAEGWYDTGSGRIESAWRIQGKRVVYTLTVPQGHYATMKLKGKKPRKLKAGKHKVII